MSFARFLDPGAAAAWCQAQRRAGRTIGFVPTMGALHEGHLSLVRRAALENDCVCVSIFVNPLQFGESRDFERYPRDFEGDCTLLQTAGADMAFTGHLQQFFPEQPADVSAWSPSDLEDPSEFAMGLEGAFRPGHFEGVATIVRRLWEVTRPDRAYFGAKDYQQTLVVKALAQRLGYPKVVVCTTHREESGLARSSRNVLLGPEDRQAAMFLSRALFAAKGLWARGVRDPNELEGLMLAVLGLGNLSVEYAAVRDPRAWTAAVSSQRLDRAVALVAARAGSVRLIDNLELSEETNGEGDV